MSAKRRGKAGRQHGTKRYYVLVAAVLLIVIAASAYLLVPRGQTGTATSSNSSKPIILYINQGNGIVNESNFGNMLSFASSRGFNTLFFQVFREGNLLFDQQELETFVGQSHSAGLKIFFSLYFTNASQSIPTSVYGLGEDGISLDMSALSTSSQQALLTQLTEGYRGETAVTTTNMTSGLQPDILVLETYGTAYQQYIRQGIVASVGVFTTTSQQEYESEFQYALEHSDGVMVFDYAGLMKAGYT